MRIKRTCKICGDPFMAIKVTQFFCRRKCFKKDYYLRTKNSLQDREQNPVYPSKECGFCLKMSNLGFDPLELPKRFDTWGCPYCGATNSLVWEHQGNPNSYQIISQILVSIQMFSSAISQPVQPTYRTYNLPISRLEQGNPHIVVLACEKMNIFDIQRSNRKKILFS